MQTVFVVSDTHFGHRKVVEFRPFTTVEEHDEALVANWNSVVRKGDTVWHLGDVAFGKVALATVARLNGIKNLVMGNHDAYGAAEYLRFFNKVVAGTVKHGALLTHIPVHPGQLDRFGVNVHGHLHAAVLDDPRYLNVSMEQIGYTPVPLLEVLKHNTHP